MPGFQLCGASTVIAEQVAGRRIQIKAAGFKCHRQIFFCLPRFILKLQRFQKRGVLFFGVAELEFHNALFFVDVYLQTGTSGGAFFSYISLSNEPIYSSAQARSRGQLEADSQFFRLPLFQQTLYLFHQLFHFRNICIVVMPCRADQSA